MNVELRQRFPCRDGFKIAPLCLEERHKRRRRLENYFATTLFEFRDISIKLNCIAETLLRMDQNRLAGNVVGFEQILLRKIANRRRE